MNKFHGLENVAPSIIKFPFVSAFKAIVNIKLGRKIPSSIARIAALCLGLFMGYFFPGIGSFMSFFLGLFVTNPLSVSLVTGLNYAVSMVLSAAVFMFITKKIFQYYYLNKYGVTNPELRLTEKDIKQLRLLYEDDGLTRQEINKKIDSINARVRYLVNQIKLYKIIGQETKQKALKYALNCLKRGDFSVFHEFYEEDFNKKKGSINKFIKDSKRHDSDSLSGYSNSESDESSGYWGKYDNDASSSSSSSSSDGEDDYYYDFDNDYGLKANLGPSKIDFMNLKQKITKPQLSLYTTRANHAESDRHDEALTGRRCRVNQRSR